MIMDYFCSGKALIFGYKTYSVFRLFTCQIYIIYVAAYWHLGFKKMHA